MRVRGGKELKRLSGAAGVHGRVDGPVICIQMTLGWMNPPPAGRLTDLLLLLLRFSHGVRPHQGGFVAGADPSGASPPPVQPAEAGRPAASPRCGQARPPHQVNLAATPPPAAVADGNAKRGPPPGGDLHY